MASITFAAAEFKIKGTVMIRFVAIALLIIAIFSVVDRYPDFRSEQERLKTGRDHTAMQTIGEK